MKYLLFALLAGLTCTVSAQNEFELRRNKETNRVFYQAAIDNPDLSKAALFIKGVSWFERKDKKMTFNDEKVGRIVGEANFSTVGKKSAYGKSYYYNFTAEITLEFKDGKTRYTFDNFMKKSSPGEPGSTLEYFIENYKPNISSQKARDREAKMLDQIEIAIDTQVLDIIDELKESFGVESKSDW